MARKRQERAVKTSQKKGQKTTKSGNDSETDGFVSFNNNLAVLGLNLREVPGDGNCLFRALGDQIEGHGRNHLKHRLKTVEYMQQNRADFEPFVEDDKSFDYHINNLSKPGIYAGNDAIVAFARLYGATVFIHQLDAPLWQINGGSGSSALGTELHIAYHNGDHYNSIRKLGDNSEAPANIRLGNQHQHVPENCDSEKFTEEYQYCNSEDDCEEPSLVQTEDAKEQCNTCDLTAEIPNIHRLRCSNDDVSTSQTEADEIENKIIGKIGAAQSLPDIKGSSILVVLPNEKISDHKPLCRRLSNKERKAMKRAERKKASEERKRQNTVTVSQDIESEGDHRVTWTILKDLGCLTI